MTPAEVAAILRQFNEWRRSDYEPSEQPAPPDPREIGEAIDSAIEMIDRLEAAEKDIALKERVIDALGSELTEVAKECDALRAKIAEMEQQEPVAWMLNCQTLGGGTGWILSWTQSGAGLCNRLSGEENEKKLYALPGAQAQPAPNLSDAYQGAMEEVAIWKKRALEAEELNRKFVAEINGPVYMGEPAQPAPSVPDDVIEQAVNRFLSWKLPKDFHPDGGMVFIPTKGRGYDSPHWPIGTNLLNAQQAREMLRHVLAAPESKS